RRLVLRRGDLERLDFLVADQDGDLDRLLVGEVGVGLEAERKLAGQGDVVRGVQDVAARVDGAELDVPVLGGLEVAGADPALRYGRQLGGDGPLHDALGGGEVLLHEQRRQRQHVGDVVEAVADVVGGEVLGGVEIYADEVADGVVVFGAVEPANGDA